MPKGRSATRKAGGFGANPKYEPPVEDYDPATTRYIRAGASGSNNGTDWTNAYTSIPASLTRGYTYFVADGSYGSYTFDDALSGTSVITLKKATGSSHGTSTGWDAAYGDGVATFGTLTLNRGYIIIDGVTRGTDWSVSSSYGFRISGVTANSLNGDAAHFSQVRYASLGESDSATYVDAGWGPCAYLVYNQHDVTFSYCSLHNATGTLVQGAGAYNLTFEYCWFGPSWGKEAIRGGNGSASYNWTIRHNTFWNSSQTDPADGTSGITAEIGIWDSATSGSLDDNEVYGNVFHNTTSGGRNGCIVIGGNGGSWAGVGGANTKVYNNTFIGFPESSSVILLNGSNTEAKNNLAYDIAGTFNVTASSTATNVDATTDPFVNVSGKDYHIEAASEADGVGTDLGTSPYDVDRDGVSREGNWSVGAYEVA